MVTLWHEEQKISKDQGSIPATLPKVDWSFHLPGDAVKIGALHGYHTVQFNFFSNLQSSNHTMVSNNTTYLLAWITKEDYKY